MLFIKKYYGLFATAFFLLAGCEKDLTVQLPEQAGKPVINTLMNEGSPVYVRLSLSDRLPENVPFKEPASALVKLYENNVFKETLQLQQINGVNFYKSVATAVKGNSYRITAEVSGYPLAEATDLIPDKNAIQADNRRFFLLNSDNLSVSFELTNNSSTATYFRIRLLRPETPGSTISARIVLFNYENSNASLSNTDYEDMFTSTPLQPGETGLFNLVSKLTFLNTVVLEVTALTDASYKYLYTASLAKRVNDDPTAEKVSVYSNVKNGLGIVAGVAVREYTLTR